MFLSPLVAGSSHGVLSCVLCLYLHSAGVAPVSAAVFLLSPLVECCACGPARASHRAATGVPVTTIGRPRHHEGISQVGSASLSAGEPLSAPQRDCPSLCLSSGAGVQGGFRIILSQRRDMIRNERLWIPDVLTTLTLVCREASGSSTSSRWPSSRSSSATCCRHLFRGPRPEKSRGF